MINHIPRHILRCPISGQPLSEDVAARRLITADGAHVYPINDQGVPLLVRNFDHFRDYARSSERMILEYERSAAAAPVSEPSSAATTTPAPPPPPPPGLWQRCCQIPARVRAWWNRVRDYNNWFVLDDRRTEASLKARERVLEISGKEGQIVLSVGGGPVRIEDKIINLNVDAFHNVDIVGDAHELPFLDQTVDALYCEAVLEHLDDPRKGVEEMYRVLKPGALAFICTPFMQPFHGYPCHYQNFTHIGQKVLMERAGFEIIEFGACVGPAWTVNDVVEQFIHNYFSRWLINILGPLWFVFSNLFIKPLDKRLANAKNAYVLASTTYVLARR